MGIQGFRHQGERQVLFAPAFRTELFRKLLKDNSRNLHCAKRSPACRPAMLPGNPISTSCTEAKGCTCPSTCPRSGLTQQFQQSRYLHLPPPSFGSSRRSHGWNRIRKNLNVPQLFLSHAKIVPQFVHEGLADLLADFRLARTDRFDVLLIEHYVGRTARQVKDALLGRWHAVEETQKQPPLLPRLR